MKTLLTFKLSFLLVVYFVLSGFSHAFAQARITSAYISHTKSDQMVVVFSENIRLSNADGFRLIGGASRIEKLGSGNGSNKLIFELTDHVLPDDDFTLVHWQELSDARGGNEPLPTYLNIKVENKVATYKGKGNLYYVSSSGGADHSSGKTPNAPLKTIVKALSLAKPADYILLKRGDRFNEFRIEGKNGMKDNPITIGAYGKGELPVINVGRGSGVVIMNSNFIELDNLHIIKNGIGNAITIMGNTNSPVVSNLLVEGKGVMANYGINFGNNDGAKSTVINPRIINNTVKNFRWNIRSSGYPYDGTHHIKGGLIENNISAGNFRDPDSKDGISAQRGNFHGLIIRKNEVYGWVDDAMDFFAAENVVVEYNVIHDPMQISFSSEKSGAGNGIKAGGITRSDVIKGKKSQKITVRYNQVYNIRNGNNKNASLNAITTNNGGSGKIYGNLIYNVEHAGIAIFGSPEDWEIHNNTVNDAEIGINAYTMNGNPNKVIISNNIIQGRKRTINVNTQGKGNFRGFHNVLIGLPPFGHYSGQNDISASIKEVFENTRTFELKQNSPAVNSGVAIPAYARDLRGYKINGNLDAGALESGSQTGLADIKDPQVQPPVTDNNPPKEPENRSKDDPNGLHYRYYEGTWKELPDFSKLNIVKEGKVKQIELTERKRDDLFAFVFDAYLEIDKGGSYTFYTISNDGSRLFIDGQMVVDNDGLHGARERSGSIRLEAGRHPIRITFFERGRKEMLQVKYQGEGISKRIIPEEKLFLYDVQKTTKAVSVRENENNSSTNASVEQSYLSGIRYSYYEGIWRALPDFKNLSAVKTGVVDDFILNNRNRNDYFAFLYEGFIKIDESAEYTFSTISDDGSQLFIGETKVVDNDGLHGPRKRTGRVYLEKGYHPIRLSYFERGGGETLRVQFSKKGMQERALPPSMLFYQSENNNKRQLSSAKSSSSQNEILTTKQENQLPSFTENTFIVFPNPFDGELQVSLYQQQAELHLQLHHVNGKLLKEFDLKPSYLNNSFKLDLADLVDGVYILKLYHQQKLVALKKIIKR